MFKSIRGFLMILALFAVTLTNVFAQPIAPIQNGRFQIFFNPNVRADTFLLDTQTGKVWQLTKFTNLIGDPTVWNRMERIDDDKQEFQLTRSYGVKKTEEPEEPTSK
jgi:hypothetical protein